VGGDVPQQEHLGLDLVLGNVPDGFADLPHVGHRLGAGEQDDLGAEPADGSHKGIDRSFLDGDHFDRFVGFQRFQNPGQNQVRGAIEKNRRLRDS
jgi:hypothetical protein